MSDNTYYPRAYVNQLSNTGESNDSSAMTIKQTINYSKIDDCISIGTIYGKVLDANTGSGIYPESMEFEAHILHGGVYDEYGNQTASHGQVDRISPTFYDIGIGDNYYKQYDIGNISDFYYLNGSIYHMDTILNVTATRGVSASVRINLMSQL